MKNYRIWLCALGSVLMVSSLTQCTSDVPLPAGSVKLVDAQALQLMKEAQTAVDANRVDRAIKRYKKVVKDHALSVNAPEARFRLGQLYERKDDPIEAFDQYQYLIDNHPDSPLYKAALSRQKEIAFGAAEGKIKNKVLWLFDVSADPSHVTKWLKAIAQNAPYSDMAPQALFVLGEYSLKRNRMEEAMSAFQSLVDDYKQSKLMPIAQMRVADIYRGRAAGGDKSLLNVNRARETYEDLLQLYPGGPNSTAAKKNLEEIQRYLVEQKLHVADYYQYKMKDRDAAIFCYGEVIRMGKDNPSAAAKARQELKKMGVSAK